MDQEILWSDVILNPVESPNLQGPQVFSRDTNVPYIDLLDEDSADLSIWNSAGASSSRSSPGVNEETKVELGWASSLTINESQGSRTQERQAERTTMLLGSRIGGGRVETTNVVHVENMNLNLNSNQEDGSQLFSQTPSFLRNSSHSSGHINRSSLVLEAEQFSGPSIPGSSGPVNVSSSADLVGSSSRGIGFLSESTARNACDDQRLPCKRKSIEGISAQYSASGPCHIYQGENSSMISASASQNANTNLGISSSSGVSSPGEHLNPTLNIGVPDQHPHNNTISAESSQRNCRIRINPPQNVALHSNQWPSGNNSGSSDLWSSHQSSIPFIPFNQSLESSIEVAGDTLNSQPPVLSVPAVVSNMHLFPVNVASSSRAGSLSRSPAILGQRASSSRDESNSRSLPRNNISEHSVPPTHSDIRPLMQQSSSWSVAPTPQAGTGSRVVQSSGQTWITNQNPSSQYLRRLPVVARRSVTTPASTSIPQQPPSLSNTLQELNNHRAAFLRSIQQMRSAGGILGELTSARSLATRESRNRVLSEIRNALVRRGEQMEGVLFDPAVLYGGAAELQDRHRDMRLDVDNMSYEELLALTERIGNVSTGLTEETILKRLKQRKYISLTEQPPNEVEPCCVCQEEYVEEQDVGRLDCGHDFHTNCIKQWLMLKNLCPICKTTGLKER